MRLLRPFLPCVLLLSCLCHGEEAALPTADAPPAAKIKVGVTKFEVDPEVDPAVGGLVYSLVQKALLENGGFIVVDWEEIDRVMKVEAAAQPSVSADDARKMAVNKLGIEKLYMGLVIKLGAKCHIVVRIVNLDLTVEVLKRVVVSREEDIERATQELTLALGIAKPAAQAVTAAAGAPMAQVPGVAPGVPAAITPAAASPVVTAPADGQPWTVPELGMELVYIAPGSFQMGSNNGEADETPVHEVKISRGFWLGKCEVTQAEYEGVMGWNPSYLESPQNPVELVFWADAVEFCGKLTKRERTAGRLPAGCEYRLPTEAEWEYACRAGTTGDYAGDVDAMAWYDRNSGEKIHEVGTKSPNAWGLYDMHGNVWEWCLDWYAANYYARSPATDPVNTQAGADRVYRGGGWIWNLAAADCRSANRSANRNGGDPSYMNLDLGFRVSLASPVQ